MRINAIDKLKLATPRKYKSIPVRRVYIPKGRTSEIRPLGIPTIYDRAVQALYLQALVPIAEVIADPNSFGYRPGRGTLDAVITLKEILRNKKYYWKIIIYERDIQGFFDNINHQ
jgi:RNA-directed DNA polymerase